MKLTLHKDEIAELAKENLYDVYKTLKMKGVMAHSDAADIALYIKGDGISSSINIIEQDDMVVFSG